MFCQASGTNDTEDTTLRAFYIAPTELSVDGFKSSVESALSSSSGASPLTVHSREMTLVLLLNCTAAAGSANSQ